MDTCAKCAVGDVAADHSQDNKSDECGMTMEWAGFTRLRAGRIHIFCPGCGRKQSNGCRDTNDPPRATLVHVYCEKCSAGCKDAPVSFFAPSGRRIRETWEGPA